MTRRPALMQEDPDTRQVRPPIARQEAGSLSRGVFFVTAKTPTATFREKNRSPWAPDLGKQGCLSTPKCARPTPRSRLRLVKGVA